MRSAERRVAQGRRARGIGRDAEARAQAALEALGWRTLDRNVLYRGGEIDLVMAEGATIVFVEVRHRTGGAFGGAAESLDARKLARIRHAASRWLAERAQHDAPVRFDAILLDGPPSSPRLTHLHDAF